MVDTVGRRIPKGYYIRIKKGASREQIKRMLYTRFDNPDYDYDDTVNSVYRATLERDEDVTVCNDSGYSWFKDRNISKYKEFLYGNLGDW